MCPFRQTRQSNTYDLFRWAFCHRVRRTHQRPPLACPPRTHNRERPASPRRTSRSDFSTWSRCHSALPSALTSWEPPHCIPPFGTIKLSLPNRGPDQSLDMFCLRLLDPLELFHLTGFFQQSGDPWGSLHSGPRFIGDIPASPRFT